MPTDRPPRRSSVRPTAQWSEAETWLPPTNSPASPPIENPSRVVWSANRTWVYFLDGTPETWFESRQVSCVGCGRQFSDPRSHSLCGTIVLPACVRCGQEPYNRAVSPPPSGRYPENAWCPHVSAHVFRGSIPPSDATPGAAAFSVDGVPNVVFQANRRFTCTECGSSFGAGAHPNCQRRANDSGARMASEDPLGDPYGLGVSCGHCGSAIILAQPHGLSEDRCTHMSEHFSVEELPPGTARSKTITVICTLTVGLADGLRPNEVRALMAAELHKLIPDVPRKPTDPLKNGQVYRVHGTNVRLVRKLGARGSVQWR